MKFEEVMKFIIENRRIFEKFTKDLSLVTEINQQTSKKVDISNNASKGFVVFKEREYYKNQSEIFKDFLMNYFYAVSNKEEFHLSEDNIAFEFGNKRFMTDVDKLIYLSSLFLLLFDYEYIKTINTTSLEGLMMDESLWLIEINKAEIKYLDSVEIEINEKGEGKLFLRKERFSKKKDFYYNINQMITDIKKQQKQEMVSGKKYTNVGYSIDYLLETNTFQEILPEKSAKCLNDLIGKISEYGFPHKLDNEFVLKTAYNKMPKRFKRRVYTELEYVLGQTEFGERFTSENKNRREFTLIYLLVKKYSYKQMVSKKIIDKDKLYFFNDMKFKNLLFLKKIMEMDTDFHIAYIDEIFRYSFSMSRLEPTMVALYILKKCKEDQLPKLVEETKEAFKYLLGNIKFGKEVNSDDYMGIYTVENIKSGSFYKKIKQILNKSYYIQESRSYHSFPKNLKKEIAKEYLYHMMINETKYSDAGNLAYNQEPKANLEYEKVGLELFSIFKD